MLRYRDFAEAHAPEVVVRIGRPPASKTLSRWVAHSGAPVIQVGGPGVIDPDRNVAAFCSLGDLEALSGAANTPWMARWRHAAERAEAAVADSLATALSEPAACRATAQASASAGGELVVSSSMPIRDVEWFAGATGRVHANRGANGIDGVVSTAAGRALLGGPVFVLIGDIAFAHDSNALLALRHREVDLRIVVIDNAGGGIFNFLPQATALPTERFEQLFGTPHDTDLVALATAHGLDAVTVESLDELRARLALAGPTVTRLVTDRVENVALHDELHAAVATALSRR